MNARRLIKKNKGLVFIYLLAILSVVLFTKLTNQWLTEVCANQNISTPMYPTKGCNDK